eukprot:COSAG01_NODE_62383_length_285_cov_0.204301_1_plen_25_part_10
MRHLCGILLVCNGIVSDRPLRVKPH